MYAILQMITEDSRKVKRSDQEGVEKVCSLSASTDKRALSKRAMDNYVEKLLLGINYNANSITISFSSSLEIELL